MLTVLVPTAVEFPHSLHCFPWLPSHSQHHRARISVSFSSVTHDTGWVNNNSCLNVASGTMRGSATAPSASWDMTEIHTWGLMSPATRVRIKQVWKMEGWLGVDELKKSYHTDPRAKPAARPTGLTRKWGEKASRKQSKGGGGCRGGRPVLQLENKI